jgi:sugar-phosphatase
MTRALLFDFVGVLGDSTPAYRVAWSAWARTYRANEASIWVDAHGRRPDDIIRRVAPRVDLSDALLTFDLLLSATIVGRVTPLPGALALLRQLRDGEWAIVTSGRRRHVPAMLQNARLPSPAVLVCGDDVTAGKPDPECFLRAAERLKVPASRCIVIEDAPGGITAARAAAMTTVGVATTHRLDELVGADSIFASLNEASAYLLTAVRDRGDPGTDRPGQI